MFVETLDGDTDDNLLQNSSSINPSKLPDETKESDSIKDLNTVTEKPNEDPEDEDSESEDDEEDFQVEGRVKDSNVQQSRKATIKMTSHVVQTIYNSTLCHSWNKESIMTQLLDYYAEQVC